ncbi:ADP-ribosylglycohydrolase family protein [Nonomuraea sp. NPDC050556]|uniref:ADP-ribosylglycohydrolase family protein n=1 Tax=Nonomuraea sp. NPDC050556 TaxID=3364369 RepID=UPI0037976480
MEYGDRVRGCLLGGAIGDALGAPIEFSSLREIRKHHGVTGISGYIADWRGKTGLITDDTQMTLFTIEGLLSGDFTREGPLSGDFTTEGPLVGDPVLSVRQAYLRWLDTQDHKAPPPADQPWRTGTLRQEAWLYSRRAPGNACLSGLHQPFPGPVAMGAPGPVNPASKGCGTVMRSAPFGLVSRSPREAFTLAAECAQITHGHPTGYLAAGAFAAIVHQLVAGADLLPAVQDALDLLASHPAHEETTAALSAALSAASRTHPPDSPHTPTTPHRPVDPHTPEGSRTPGNPHTPTDPRTPDDPHTPTDLRAPNNPHTPDDPHTPTNPRTPTDLRMPDDPRTPDRPPMPEKPGKPNRVPRTSPAMAAPEAVEALGGAWVAEEALAIGIYCALAEPSPERALLLSVNHSGDSDSTGSVCGNLIGAWRGESALPSIWLRDLEGRDTITRLADELTARRPD